MACGAAVIGGDPAIIGKFIRLDDFPTEVIGVAPPEMRYPSPVDLWLTDAVLGEGSVGREPRVAVDRRDRPAGAGRDAGTGAERE